MKGRLGRAVAKEVELNSIYYKRLELGSSQLRVSLKGGRGKLRRPKPRKGIRKEPPASLCSIDYRAASPPTIN